MTTDTPEYLTLTEAAALLRIRPSKLSSWIRAGSLRAADVSTCPGRGKPRYRIARADLDDFLVTRQPIPKPRQTRTRRSTPRPVRDWLT